MAFSFVTPAHAQTRPGCTTRALLLEGLLKKYGEAPVSMGLANNGGMIEILTTEDGDTWTIIITMPSGLSCFLASGEGWRTAVELKRGTAA